MALYWRAFGRQILPLPVRAARGQALLLRCLHPFRALSAEADGALIGVIGLRDASGGLFGPEPAQIQAIWPGGTGRILNAATRLHRAGPASDEMVIDGIVVAPAWRGRGIAPPLVRAATAEAAARGFAGLRAEVAPRNRAALALYQSLGFTQIAQARIGWPWSRLLSGKARIMRLALRPLPGCPPSP
ncbi:GNAT family N-acetyltransferase [Paracoccus sp. DMF-8]|uniref:GNAT family N-acetyltransferase n=1 Tax=Paracoccus sp. DMF-8 TaxID=3019445 RepID=UPI0023E8D574|nr:GNAT family N-acetyltransferase [Paracoccus sp. DMF-8]MDF3607015.1 GNAT family N-acetyltransferase [Paracoccus sp. DMF-8]